MTEIVSLLGNRRVSRPTVEREASCGNADKSGYHSKEGRFAGAIAPGNDQRFTRGHLKADVPEHLAAAPAAGEAFGLKFHHGCKLGSAVGQYPENLNSFGVFRR